MYSEQSLYPSDSVPDLVRRINQALIRPDQIQHFEGRDGIYWFAPVMPDREASIGGNLNAFVLTKAMIEAGVAGVHFEDQLSSAKNCGHLCGKMLVPTCVAIDRLMASSLPPDVLGVPTILIARTDADNASLLTNDTDPRDREFILAGQPTSEGLFRVRGGLSSAIARRLASAACTDLLWCET
jgi:isocitrate lyase